MPPLAMLQDAREKNLDPIHNPANQHAQAPVPIAEFRDLDRPDQTDARIVAENMHLSENPFGLIRGLNIGFAIRDVKLEYIHLFPTARLVEEGARFRHAIFTNVRNDHPHPCIDKGLCHPEPESAGAPGNECDLSCHILHDRFLPRDLI